MLADQAIMENELSKEEAHALEWWIRSIYNTSQKPQNCDYCFKPESRGVTFQTEEAKEAFITAEREGLGCLDSRPSRIPYRFDDGYELNVCPHKIIRDSKLGEYVRAYNWLENHRILPWGDDLSEHSERFIQAMEVIKACIKKVERENQEKADRKNATPKNSGYSKGRRKGG